MSRSMIRTVAAAAALSLAPLATAHAQEAFAPADAGSATSGAEVWGAEATEGKVMRVEGVASRSESAYRHIARTNAAWLASRGPQEFPMRSHVVVYRDGVPVGSVEALRRIPANEVAEVRYLNPLQASRHFGIDHGAGALLLTSK